MWITGVFKLRPFLICELTFNSLFKTQLEVILNFLADF